MTKPTLNSILFNAAGIGILISTFSYLGYSFFVTEKIPRCSSRYLSPTQFDFSAENGKPMTPLELQARGGTSEWGVLQNANIVAGSGGAPDRILKVALAPTNNEDKVDQNGVSFVWNVDNLNNATSSCLSYKVFIPADFSFPEPGYLPGVFGIGPQAPEPEEGEQAKPSEGFQVRIAWAAKGDVGVEVRSAKSEGTWLFASRTTLWPVDRWVDVEQEVVLNTPGVEDGKVRTWIDGSLVIDYDQAYFRGVQETLRSGVLAEIGYARSASDPKTLQISPFRIGWQ